MQRRTVVGVWSMVLVLGVFLASHVPAWAARSVEHAAIAEPARAAAVGITGPTGTSGPTGSLRGLAPWTLKLMTDLLPSAIEMPRHYPAIAQAIADVAEAEPLPDDPGGVETAALLVALASFESSFNPHAMREDRGGDSIGLVQVNVSNLAALHMTRADLFDPRKNLHAGLVLLRASRRTCRGRPKLDQLAQYASGGGTCAVEAGLKASRHRMLRAQTLLRSRRAFWVETR